MNTHLLASVPYTLVPISHINLHFIACKANRIHVATQQEEKRSHFEVSSVFITLTKLSGLLTYCVWGNDSILLLKRVLDAHDNYTE